MPKSALREVLPALMEVEILLGVLVNIVPPVGACSPLRSEQNRLLGEAMQLGPRGTASVQRKT